jgi:hypothetical protein
VVFNFKINAAGSFKRTWSTRPSARNHNADIFVSHFFVAVTQRITGAPPVVSAVMADELSESTRVKLRSNEPVANRRGRPASEKQSRNLAVLFDDKNLARSNSRLDS